MGARRLGFRLAVLAGVWMVLASAPGDAGLRHTALAGKAWSRAVEQQRKLEAKSARHRTRAEYEQVILEYRHVYYYDFAYVKAPVAAENTGDLYVEMGRLFHDPACFQSAIKSYQYVVSQYPGTRMARESALAVGNVYLERLNDPERAESAYREVLKVLPGSSQSREAKKKLKEIADLQAAREKQESAKASAAAEAGNADVHSDGGPVEVTEIHKWVGPNYTRVVIGAQGPFKYNTLRLSHPDRIVFDLADTRVDRALLKSSFSINGAYLRDIRVGQFKPDVTRIVLDVKDISDYSAFPVPNPFRLIIDVHGASNETPAPAAERGKLAVNTAAKTSPLKRVPAEEKPAVMKHTQTSPEEEVPGASGPAVEAAKQNAGGAIEFADQQAAAAMAGGQATKHTAEKPVKTRTKTASDHSVRQPEKPETEAAASRHVAKPAKPEAKAAPDQVEDEGEGKVEAKASRHASLAAKHKTEVAADETRQQPSPISTKPASPTEDGSQTLTRALGLKVARIVIDAGHGGFDTGTIGPTGLEEKNIVLDVALRLRKLIETETNSEVFMTRSTDKFIPLEERTAIANEDGADLFISIHANASSDHHVRGIETYFLNFTSDPETLKLAARENATSQESVYQLQSLIKKIALNNKIEESQELARDIQSTLYKRMSRASHGIHNRGVRKAPFVVLIGANMPSILTEISFLSNPHSEHLLREPAYREQIAKALFKGIENYINNLGSVRIAQRTQ